MSKMYSTANLSDKELKEQGNRLFDLHKYEDAASCYTKAIVSIITFLAHNDARITWIVIHATSLASIVIATKYFLFWIESRSVPAITGTTVPLTPDVRTRIRRKRGRFKFGCAHMAKQYPSHVRMRREILLYKSDSLYFSLYFITNICLLYLRWRIQVRRYIIQIERYVTWNWNDGNPYVRTADGP